MAEKKIVSIDEHVKEIVTDYESLSIRSIEFDLKKLSNDCRNMILEMKSTMRANHLKGFSACQIGYYARVICLDFNGNIKTFINPIITNVEGFELSRESCVSLDNKVFIRPRNSKIDIMYQTPLGKAQSATLVGYAAKLFQHHMDHLDGILLSDIALEIDDDFDNASVEDKEAIIDMYLDSLDIKQQEIQTAIEEDDEAKKFADAVKFLESVEKGETIVETEEITKEEYEKFTNQNNSERSSETL